MEQLMLILLVIAVIVLFIAAVWLFMPHKKETIDIHLDKNTKMNISHAENGSIRMEMTHVISEYDDAPLVPDVVGDYLNKGQNVIDRDFIHKLAVFSSLGVDEKEHIMSVLINNEIITENEANTYLHYDEGAGNADANANTDGNHNVSGSHDIPDEPDHEDMPTDDFDNNDLN